MTSDYERSRSYWRQTCEELERQNYTLEQRLAAAEQGRDALRAERDALRQALEWYAAECSMPETAEEALAALTGDGGSAAE